MTLIPVACSLDAPTLQTRSRQWHDLLAPNVVAREAVPGGVRLRLRAGAGLAEQIRKLITLEDTCCPWITWTLDEGTALLVEATAENEQGIRLIHEWFGLAEADPVVR